MATGIVFRPVARDAHGDPIDNDGNIIRLSGNGVARLGEIDGLIIGGPSGSSRPVANLNLRGDVIATEGMLGFPANSPIQLQAGDVVEVPEVGQRFGVTGPVLWGRPHSLTGRPPRYRWISATGN